MAPEKSLKVQSHDAILHQILIDLLKKFDWNRLLRSSLIGFYNRFSINETSSIFLLYGKKSLWRHDSRQRVDWKSDAIQIFNQLHTLLSTCMVTRYDFNRKRFGGKLWSNILWKVVSDRTLMLCVNMNHIYVNKN